MKKNKTFSKETIQETLAVDISNSNFGARKKVKGYTIDGAGSRDLDDGFTIYSFPTYNILQISIADVAEFVKPGTNLFKQALERIETRYLRTHNIPMLPEVLSEDKLSLLEGKETPSISIDLKLNLNYELIDIDIYESMFYNIHKFNYQEVSKLLRNECSYPELKQVYQMAAKLLSRRIENNELVVYDAKKGVYSDEDGNLKKIEDKESEGYIIVQEMMILTNKSLSGFMAKKDIPIIFRNHTARNNSPERDELIEIMKMAGANETLFNQLAGKVALWFNKAHYSPVLKGHFALNASSYMHFTSPIRRLADLINHIQIKAFLHNNQYLNKEELNGISTLINKALLDFDNDKSNFFKQQAKHEARKNIEYASKEKLISADDKSFNMILKIAFLQEEIPEELELAIKHKLENDKLNINQIYKLIFADKSENWNQLVELTKGHIKNNTGFANQLLNIHVNKESNLRSIAVEAVDTSSDFAARLIGLIDKCLMSNTNYSFGKSKKEAHNHASINFLFAYLANELVMASETKQVDIQNLTEMETYDSDKNFLSEINNLYQKDKSWSKPIFEIKLEGGTPNNPVFSCNLTITYKDVVYKHQSMANNKKVAKILAANKIYNEIIKHL